MSWTPDLIIGELRPWPDAVLVRRGDTDETMQYTITPLPHFWTHDGTLHVEAARLPECIDLALPDERGREVHSARVHRFVPERTCRRTMDSLDPFCMWVCDCCGHPLDTSENFCGGCGAKVVDE